MFPGNQEEHLATVNDSRCHRLQQQQQQQLCRQRRTQLSQLQQRNEVDGGCGGAAVESCSRKHTAGGSSSRSRTSGRNIFKTFICIQYIILIWATLLVEVSQGIKILDLKIPRHATKGEDVRMECNYDLEADKLYSIKWYFNGHEFYRYIPSDSPRTTIFDRPGINVDRRQSSETHIVLRSVGLKTTGKFKCEVSGEAPLFQTASDDDILAVVDLPDEGPIITGGYPRYHVGDKVKVNCTSRRSRPAAKLRWYINGEQADHHHVKHYDVETERLSGLQTSTLGLWFKVRDKHFKNGDMKLKCTATIASIYWKSNEESVQGVRTQSALVSESRSSRNSAASNSDGEAGIFLNDNMHQQQNPSLEDIFYSSSSSAPSSCVISLLSSTVHIYLAQLLAINVIMVAVLGGGGGILTPF